MRAQLTWSQTQIFYVYNQIVNVVAILTEQSGFVVNALGRCRETRLGLAAICVASTYYVLVANLTFREPVFRWFQPRRINGMHFSMSEQTGYGI